MPHEWFPTNSFCLHPSDQINFSGGSMLLAQMVTALQSREAPAHPMPGSSMPLSFCCSLQSMLPECKWAIPHFRGVVLQGRYPGATSDSGVSESPGWVLFPVWWLMNMHINLLKICMMSSGLSPGIRVTAENWSRENHSVQRVAQDLSELNLSSVMQLYSFYQHEWFTVWLTSWLVDIQYCLLKAPLVK